MTQALCLTLVHSLWQGFLAAVAAGIVILCTRKAKAAVRYNWLTAVLVLFLFVAGATFVRELGGGFSVVRVTGAVEETAVLSGVQLQVAQGVLRNYGLVEQVRAFLNTHASTVVMIWLFCLLVQLVRLMGGLYKMGRMRRYRAFAPTEGWQERLSLLAGQLGIQKPVSLLQSALVTVPVAFGYLKPSILVPLGMLMNLPADQVETILLHELAHIRRNDYLMNLVLHITDAIFFFNPGIRWVASLLREEREACCDDVVLLGTADRNSYFDALVAFREYTIGKQQYVLPLGQGKTDLLWRIRRMLNQENKNLHIMEKAILSLGLTALLAVGLLSMRAGDKQAEQRNLAAVQAWQGTDTLPGTARREKVQFPTINTKVEDNGASKQCKINATDVDGNTFELTKVNGKVTELIINGKSIPQKDFDQYLYIFEEIEIRTHETALAQEGEDQVEMAQRDLEKAQERLKAANQQQAEAQERQEQADAAKQEAIEKQQEEAQQKLEAQQREQEEKLEAQETQRQELEAKQQAQEAQQQEMEAQQQNEEAENVGSANRAIKHIIHDLIDAGVIKSKEEVHMFALDNNGLTVNDVRQSAEVCIDPL